MKKATSLRVPSMSCKAFNGRVVMEYLASVARLAATRSGGWAATAFWNLENGKAAVWRSIVSRKPADPHPSFGHVAKLESTF